MTESQEWRHEVNDPSARVHDFLEALWGTIKPVTEFAPEQAKSLLADPEAVTAELDAHIGEYWDPALNSPLALVLTRLLFLGALTERAAGHQIVRPDSVG
jgi:hypothetical protein